ncbi:DNA polymerase III subunit alpha [Thermotoga sp. RQ2]|uniref:DNA polymerase III subunit alpha n=1 Tax=Thermotoga sp. (strain RQ2) TaxID=126740 RepID=UPI000160187E|nr:DNA polymerase III subunit alpha [Thermotoga sp. RQ2]ACB08716.1 DNA polymerase III, alpha subunit [Thermotoga sp. RQ2]
MEKIENLKWKDVTFESIEIDPDAGVVLVSVEKFSSEVENLVSLLEKETRFRVIVNGAQKSNGDLKGKILSLLNGNVPYIKDVVFEGNRLILKVLGDFARDRIASKLRSTKKQLDELLPPGTEIMFEVVEPPEDLLKKEVPQPEKREEPKGEELKIEDENHIFGQKPRKIVFTPSKIFEYNKKTSVKGKVFKIEKIEGKKTVLLIYLTDGEDSLICKVFNDVEKVEGKISLGDVIVATGDLLLENGEPTLYVKGITKLPEAKRMDNSPVKRVELHAHTKFSDQDAITDVNEYVKRAKEWGFPAVALTDHGNVQAIPYFYDAAKEAGIKPIFGIEAYLVSDVEPVIRNLSYDSSFENATFVVLDFETTGLDPQVDEIIEIGAVKIQDGQIVDEYHTLIKPSREISRRSSEITGITQEMLENKRSIEEVLPEFLGFLENSIIVAHNANFDYRFLRLWIKKVMGLDWERPYIDTLALAKSLLKMRSYSLDSVVEKLGLGPFRHHRALDDARVTAQVFLRFVEMMKKIGITKLSEIENLKDTIDYTALKPFHCTILVQNKKGLKNLYKLVSDSYIKYFYGVPRILKSALIENREGLLVGSACISGELGRAALEGASDSELEEIAKFYDYIEVMPLDVIAEDEEDLDRERLKEVYRRLYRIAKKLNKFVVMTGDVHFLDPEDARGRAALLAPQGNRNFENQPALYLRTTEEMLEKAMEIFEDEEIAREVVIENPNRIADMIEEVQPLEKKLHPPIIENADEIVRNLTMKRAYEIYGDPLPEIVQKRVEKELNAIINHGYAVLYLIAQELVQKSMSDGYVVGSRGSVGSSLVANLLGITEVNPLPPHYRCPECKYFEVVEDDRYGAGYDLPDKKCPVCGAPLKKDGHDIPFETFMGFEGDKVPDIDLNFSGEYQERAHRFVEELFGKDHVYRAGTINTIAEKSAVGYVRSYEEKTGKKLRKAEMERLVSMITGVKRTTGQHPGGLMIIPKDKEVYDFTPIQYPANDRNAGVFTTHFAYETIHDDLVKIDALGHDDPTFIKMLKDLTGIDPMTIPMDDPETLAIFSSVKPLGVDPVELESDVGTYGIPEFGTEFVRGMLVETRPKSFAELVRISGLSHGTDVWLNNARDWINLGYAKLSDVISCRDDIMNFLIHKGMEPSLAFKIMENVRKGKGITEEMESEMRKLKVPEWFIESCKRIKYLFPKAHAVAYVSMAFRIAYFKVHYPLQFYAAYFTIKGDQFDPVLVLRGKEAIKRRLRELKAMPAKDAQKKNEVSVLEVALEMILRGFSFLPPDIFKSDAKKFLIEGNSLRIPFNKLPGLGDSVAESIIRAREEKPFTSVEDLMKRTKVNKNHIELMKSLGVLGDLPETEQFTLF